MTSPATPLIGCRENRYWSERTSFTGRPTARGAAVEGTSIAFSSLSLLFFLYYCLPSALCLPCSLSLTAPLPYPLPPFTGEFKVPSPPPSLRPALLPSPAASYLRRRRRCSPPLLLSGVWDPSDFHSKA